VLEYLVTSKVRRRLLVLLWAQKKRGSITELAELASVAFAGAHGELKAMQRVELVVTERESNKEVFAANFEHPKADALRSLVAADVQSSTSDDDQVLKQSLVALGAPLRGVRPREVAASARMQTLVRGVELARRDAVVARSLSLCFWKLRDALDLRALAELTPRAEDKHALGFFLELTGELGGDRRLVGLAESLRDRRMTSVRDFFRSSTRDVSRNFALAAKWGFRMNMDLDSFRSLFDKFVTK
jgi:hypothetical protein